MPRLTVKNEQFPPLNPNTKLSKAAAIYLERRRTYLKPRSVEMYEYHFRTLIRFFGPDKKLSSFREGSLREYQQWRLTSGATRKPGPSCINHELGALSQLLEFAGLWAPIERYYERLPEPFWSPPKALTAEEEQRFFRVAASRPEWAVAYHCAVITSNTTVAGCELRFLRIEDVHLDQDPPVIHVHQKTKNAHRVRAVPLNEEALASIRHLLRMARRRGSCRPDHHLFPFSTKRNIFDPQRPASSTFIRYAFRQIARESGLPWLTPRCFRHQAITKLLERGAPDETVRAVAGHVSERAMNFYSHIRIEAKRAALDRLLQAPATKTAVPRLRAGKNRKTSARFTATASKLGIPPEDALELILAYERERSSR